MREIRFFIVAVALVAAAVAFARSGMMAAAAPAAPEVVPAETLIHKATVVCGTNGCSVVQTRRLQRHQLPKTTTVHSPL